MRKGDILYQLKVEGAWTHVQNAITGEEGFVPSSFVVKVNSLDAEPWFFGPITRSKVCLDVATRISLHRILLLI